MLKNQFYTKWFYEIKPKWKNGSNNKDWVKSNEKSKNRTKMDYLKNNFKNGFCRKKALKKYQTFLEQDTWMQNLIVWYREKNVSGLNHLLAKPFMDSSHLPLLL